MKFGNIINEILSNIPDNFLPKEDFENFLNNDQFSTEVINDPQKEYLFEKLENLKKEFREFLHGVGNDNISPQNVYDAIKYGKIIISNFRLVIEPQFTIMLHKNIPKNKEYVVARAYWINWNGKKERKFSQNINKNTHQITDSLKKEISNKFTNIMWEYFKNEISNK